MPRLENSVGAKSCEIVLSLLEVWTFKCSEKLLRGFKHRSDVTDLLALKDCSGCRLWRESRVLGVSVEKRGIPGQSPQLLDI